VNSLSILMSGLVLGLFGVLGAALVGVSHEGTAERIAENERAALQAKLEALVPAADVDNDMLEDVIRVEAPEKLGAPFTRVYRARRDGEPVAAVLSPVVTQGYSGPIQLVVAVGADGRVGGVRVLSHRETPGLGDKIELERGDWILDFAGRSLRNPLPEDWAVQRDGGVFDQFTGATVTPRAVVRGVKSTLEYFAAHKDQLFEQTSATDGETP
jgi:electron transport complex protein RnfG